MPFSCKGRGFWAIKVEGKDGKDKVKSFDNNKDGFEAFIEWAQTFSNEKYHYCMESTGKYGNDLALFLYNENDVISIVNPVRIKYFMKSQLTRNKTDSIDSKHIRHYCELFKPSPWEPLSAELQELQDLVKRVDALNNTLLQEQNRLERLEMKCWR